jgi:hypothetical protein
MVVERSRNAISTPLNERFHTAAYVLPLGYSHLTWQNLKGCTNHSLKSFCTALRKSDYPFGNHQLNCKLFAGQVNPFDKLRMTTAQGGMPSYSSFTFYIIEIGILK